MIEPRFDVLNNDDLTVVTGMQVHGGIALAADGSKSASSVILSIDGVRNGEQVHHDLAFPSEGVEEWTEDIRDVKMEITRQQRSWTGGLSG